MEYNISIGEAVLRYVLMMAIVILAGFTGQWYFALLALPIFLTAITGWCPLKTLFQNRMQIGAH